MPERTRFTGCAFVARGLTNEVQPLCGACAGRVEEVPVATGLVGSFEATSELAPLVVVKEWRHAPTSRQRPFFKPEHEHGAERSRSSAKEIEHGDTTGFGRRRPRQRAALKRRDNVVLAHRLAHVGPALQLSEHGECGGVGAKVAACCLSHGRCFQPVGKAQHRPDKRGCSREWGVGVAQVAERNEWRLTQPLGLCFHPFGSIDRPATKSTLDEVNVGARDARKRRAHEREELPSCATAPREAEQRDQRVAERGRAQALRHLHRIRDSERAEDGLERRSIRVWGGRDHADLFGRHAVANQAEDLLGDEFQRSTGSCAFKEADGATDLRHVGRLDKELALKMDEGGNVPLRSPRRELLDPSVCEGREILDRPLQRRERSSARFVRQRYGDVGSARESREHRPLGRGEIFKSVGEHGLSIPRVEFGFESTHGGDAHEFPVTSSDLGEARPIAGVERCEIAVQISGFEQSRFEFDDRLRKRVGETREA